MGALVSRTLPEVYIIYVPSREKFCTRYASDLRAVSEAAISDLMHATFCPIRYDALDAATAKYSVNHIVSHVHKRPLRSFHRIWIAGTGSSAYARAVIDAAYHFEVPIPVSDHTPKGSLLGRYLALFARHRAHAAFEVGARMGFFGNAG